MIFKLLLDKNSPEEVSATVHERTPLIDEIERLILQADLKDQMPGYIEDDIVMLETRKIECFTAENDKTYAVYCDGKRYVIHRRLYELEQALPSGFERISKSAIAGWKSIARFKVQLSGAVDAVFRCGWTECISRRCFRELRRRYDL